MKKRESHDYRAARLYALDRARSSQCRPWPWLRRQSTLRRVLTPTSSQAGATRRTLDIGCGREKLPGALGLDKNPRSDADIIHDLDQRPWPLDADSFDYVRAQDVLEHVDDFFGVMEEIYRVCRDGALVEVRMPFMSSLHFATDPTHRRAGTSASFDYFDPRLPLGRYQYSTAHFEKVKFVYGRFHPGVIGKVFQVLDTVVVPLCQRFPRGYEHFFAYVYPMHDVTYTLRAVKQSG
ncbi:MAG: methyltransferase domain-containing protein [Polyangiales bacterium]